MSSEDETEPAVAYIFKTFKHPELIVFGLPLEVMEDILNACGEEIREGRSMTLVQPVGNVLEGINVRFREIRDQESYDELVGYALWWNDGADFPLWQLMWPDSFGKFPDELPQERQPLPK